MSSKFAYVFPDLGNMLKTDWLYLYNSDKVMEVNRIRELRISRDMKQSDLARLLNCASTAISKYELGQLDLNSATICRLCEIFGCTADYLLGRSTLPSPELSEEESRLLLAFRRGDDRARDMVRVALGPFVLDLGSSETA